MNKASNATHNSRLGHGHIKYFRGDNESLVSRGFPGILRLCEPREQKPKSNARTACLCSACMKLHEERARGNSAAANPSSPHAYYAMLAVGLEAVATTVLSSSSVQCDADKEVAAQ